MRFITQFELRTPFEIKNYKSLREKGTAEWLGLDIAKAFGWQSRGETTLDLHSPVSERHTLEIEAFPMDKWLKFKAGINECIEQAKANNYPPMFALLSIGNLMKELESTENESSGQ